MRLHIVTLVSLVSFSAAVTSSFLAAEVDGSQLAPCGTRITSGKKIFVSNLLETRLQEAKQINGSFPRENTDFSVLWHVISKDGTIEGGNITDEAINSAMQKLNEGFSNASISFTLKNITRTVDLNLYTNADEGNIYQDQMKQQLHQGGSNTLNIYSTGLLVLTDIGKLLGYSTFPWDYQNKTWDDGVVIDKDTVPGGPYLTDRSDAGTLVHEVGHWVGLYHTFEGGCYGDGDYVDDTPPEYSSACGCPFGRDTCHDDTEPDPIDNFMDYTSDSCRVRFTPGQITRMHQQILAYRIL